MLKRNIRIVVMLDEKEKAKLDRRVEKSKLSLSEYVRLCCVGKEKVIFIDAVEIAEIHNAINRIGNNVNQITRLANAKKNVDQAYVERLNNILSALRIEVNEKLEKIYHNY